MYSTYFGGEASESALVMGQGVAVDADGNAYVTGQTASLDFPTAAPLQASRAGASDASPIRPGTAWQAPRSSNCQP